MEEVKEKKVISLSPLSKWKRILIFLGDYFATFIVSFILFNLAIFPLAKSIFSTEKQSLKARDYEIAANEALIKDGLLFRSSSNEQTLEEHVDYTFKVFLSYYVFDEEKPDHDHPQYGHKAENEVISVFYNKHLSKEQYFADFIKENSADNMFEINQESSLITLKSDYKTLLANELLEVEDESKYSTNMTNVRDHVFARMFYIHIYQDYIQKNDLVVDGVSYLGSVNAAKNIYQGLNWIVTASSLISVIISWGGFFLLYPLLNGERRTLTMSAIKANKLHFKTQKQVTRGLIAVQSFYHLVFCLSSAVFLPILYFGISYCFNLPLLLIFMFISVGLMIVSLFFILFNQHNRSGSDILTQTIVIPASEIDMLYRELNHE